MEGAEHVHIKVLSMPMLMPCLSKVCQQQRGVSLDPTSNLGGGGVVACRIFLSSSGFECTVTAIL